MNVEEKIIKLIKENKKVSRYRELEHLVNSNERLLSKMKEIKSLQKEIMHAEKLEKQQINIELNEKYQRLMKDFEAEPLMIEYLQLQEEINAFLKDFKDIINEGIEKDLTTIL
ncbi:MAG: YlbF family regulator [Acholeplasma sp.]|nr:YlbF family regulator [Acholeplasma sp.]